MSLSHRRIGNRLGLLVAVVLAPIARSDFDSGSDGSDGVFNPPGNVVIDLSLASDGAWNTPSPNAGFGVYDPDQWAVVFKYTTINVPAGVTVTFVNHPSGAPVVWLASGDVTIVGTVNLSGGNGHPSGVPYYSPAGPGGFEGARASVNAHGGFGPGGAIDILNTPGSGSYVSQGGADNGQAPTYGNSQIIPLIGGSSGGTASQFSVGAGAGGGALLIASSTQLTLSSSGAIRANGGTGIQQGAGMGSGSGGAIRLIADVIQGNGLLSVSGAQAGGGFPSSPGRVRIEADTYSEQLNVTPTGSLSVSVPGPLFPDPVTAPTLHAVLVDAQPVTADPLAGILTHDVEINNASAATVAIEATNVPVGTTVQVRIVRADGAPFTVNSTPLANAGGGLLTATAQVTFPPGRSEMQLRANWTP